MPKETKIGGKKHHCQRRFRQQAHTFGVELEVQHAQTFRSKDQAGGREHDGTTESGTPDATGYRTIDTIDEEKRGQNRRSTLRC